MSRRPAGRTAALAAALAVIASVQVATPPAVAADTFRFRGSGYGHGVGMSQWGAYGLASAGWSHDRILEHFYRGAEVRSPSLPANVRVGVAVGERDLHLRAAGGPVEVWEGEPADGALAGTIPGGDTWTITATDAGFSVDDANGEPVGDGTWGSGATPLTLRYEPAGSRVNIAEAGFAGPGTYGRGSIELDLYGCGSGCSLRAIVRLSLDEYLYGLGEVPSSWPAAALRAQVIAARSYVVTAIRRGLRSSCNCHTSDGTSDQVYVGWSKEAGTDGDRWVAAVDATSGRAVTYAGEVIQAFYAASDGGYSENVEDVWHGGDPDFSIPWLSGVCDPGESTDANPWTDWERSFGAATVTSQLTRYTGDIGRVRDFRRAVRGESGRIVEVEVVGGSGRATISGSALRSALGLPDTRVWINADRNIVGRIRERYDQLMCAPGMPASPTTNVPGGAQQFFAEGGLYGNTGRGIVVWLKGAIDTEYRQVKAAKGVLGLPLGGAEPLGKALRCSGCRRVDLARGKIYLKPGIGAHALWGSVLRGYLDRGGPSGRLGFPETRVRRQADGDRWARFEHGTLVCGDAGRCRVV